MPPALGQFSQDSGGRPLFESPFGFVHNGGGGRSDATDVLQKEEPRTASVGNVEDVEEEARPLSIEASTSARQAEVLARESRNDAVHRSSPASSVEGEKVGPDRSRVQAAFFHASSKDAGRVGFPFHETDGASLDAKVGEPGSQSFSKHAHSGADFDGM